MSGEEGNFVVFLFSRLHIFTLFGQDKFVLYIPLFGMLLFSGILKAMHMPSQ